MTTTIRTKEAASFKVRPNALVSTEDETMFASFNASVAEVDREDELILPADYKTEYWEQNPVWLWAHDKQQLPIGAGYKPDGAVACMKTPDALILGCRFSQVNPQGVLTYGLYKEGTLKMVSVGFIATQSEKMAGTEYGVNRPITRILDPELVECSCVPIGMNRSAMLLSIKSWDGYVDRVGLASVLDKGHLHGEKVPEAMRKELAWLAEPPKQSYKDFVLAARFKWVYNNEPWTIGVNKIPKFSSIPSRKLLALHQPFGSPFMATIAKAPLKAGAIPAKTAPIVDTKAAKSDDEKEKPKEDETKSKADTEPETKPDEGGQEVVLSVGGQIWKSMMEAAAGMCKGAMEMVPQSDSEDVKSYWTRACGDMARTVGKWYDDGAKMFPDYAEEFENSAMMAAEFAALGEDPDAAMPNTEEEAELDEAEEEKAVDDDDKPKDDDEKAVTDDVVTVKAFNEWAAKSFGEATPKEVFEAMLKPYADEIETLKASVAEHREALEATEQILTGRV